MTNCCGGCPVSLFCMTGQIVVKKCIQYKKIYINTSGYEWEHLDDFPVECPKQLNGDPEFTCECDVAR